MQGLLGNTAPGIGEGKTLAELDSGWATLADAVIAFHEKLAGGGDESQLLDFYCRSAARRELAWPI